jgi:hypothetical protein
MEVENAVEESWAVVSSSMRPLKGGTGSRSLPALCIVSAVGDCPKQSIVEELCVGIVSHVQHRVYSETLLDRSASESDWQIRRTPWPPGKIRGNNTSPHHRPNSPNVGTRLESATVL